MELGGKAPAIVLDDADLDLAAKSGAFGVFHHSGQICMSTERIIVMSSVRDEFRTPLTAVIKSIPAQQLVSATSVTKNKNLVQDPVAKGAKLLPTNSAIDSTSPTKMFPVVVEGLKSDMRLFATESFRPSVSLYSVETERDAISLANDSEFGLTASVFARNLARGF